MKKIKIFKNIFALALVFLFTNFFAQCPTGSTSMPANTTTVPSGTTYCVSSDLTLTGGSLTINNGGKVVVTNGAKLTASGNFQVNGTLEIQDNSGVVLTGSAFVGAFGQSTYSSLLQMGKKSYFSITGSFVQQDNSFNGVYSTTSLIKQDAGSVIEVCATYTQQATTYAPVIYTGSAGAKSYFIVRAQANGGAGSQFSNNAEINWIAMNTVTSLSNGSATYCGPNATAATCGSWPTGLTTGSVCDQAMTIAQNLSGGGTTGSFCVTGCNYNTYINSLDPNTIEYDNMVSVFHSTIVREFDGKIKVWGQGIAQDGFGTSGNVAPPQLLNAANYGTGTNQLSGTVLRFAAGSSTNTQQFAVLTTDGLYFWGNQGVMVPLTNGANNVNSGAFRKAKVETYGTSGYKADGLPLGVNPSDVKMMFGTRDGLAIVTCTGAAWVLSSNGNTYGDGVTDSAANDLVWHRVSTAANTPLNNVVAVRGTYQTMFALTSDGNIYTWGVGTRISATGTAGNASDRQYATLMNKPAGITPKMIGMTSSTNGKSYYLLATNGNLYSMGENESRQLGTGNTTDYSEWQLVTATSGTNTLGGNIAWISPQEHEGGNYAAINIITNDGKLWAWGNSDTGMLGASGTINPTFMPGSTTGTYNPGKLNTSDKLIAVETGGHTTLTIKQCSIKFGYVGHKIRGSMANNTTDSGTETEFNFSDTAVLSICGAVSAPVVENLKICQGTTANLANAQPPIIPSGATGINWWTDAAGTIPVTNPAAVGPGTYYATYQGLVVKCPTPMTVSYYTPADPDYNTCACFNDAVTTGTAKDTKVGITLLKRAGADNTDNWPMVRKGGHIALESNTQGFVPTRIAKADLGNIAQPQEGMMVYDTTDKCLKIYTAGDWKCFNTPSCP